MVILLEIFIKLFTLFKSHFVLISLFFFQYREENKVLYNLCKR